MTSPAPSGAPRIESDAELRARVDRLCTEVLLPIVRAWPEHDRTCRPLIEALAAEKLFGLALPESYGGQGQIDRYSTILCQLRERFGYHDALIDTHFAIQGLGTSAIVQIGTPEQHARYLPGLTSGKTLFSFALTEPHSGSDVLGMKSRARREGDEWVLNGSKMFISGAPDADVYITFARTGGEEDKRAVTAFLVETGTPGFTARGGIHLQAPHAIGYLDFEECRLSDAQRLGEVGDGLRASLGTLEIFRPSVAAATIGMAQRALDLAVEFVSTREAFGATLAALPGIRLKIGRMAAQIAGGTALIQRAATLRDSGKRTVVEGALAKAFGTEAAVEIIYQSQQIHGGRGVIVGQEIEMLSRAVRPTTIYEGASEVQRSIVGRAEAKRGAAGERRGAAPEGAAAGLIGETRKTYEAWLAAASADGRAQTPAFHVRLAESAMALEAAETVSSGDAKIQLFLALAAARTIAGEVQRTGGGADLAALGAAIAAAGTCEDALALEIAETLL
ncbi:acyl-CoA dehydrogenase family protein [Sphingosinicella sp. LY1275]|uniref:acyl-CoA dehydrogenase family protein n=1 Tax=Sphingosinicella sp. LY1275 TaxID=3095379 RepID=UPI002ADEEC9F|nr:acyl-CoA dehydrogenase family protein [Sphingosinicella sp. LY1275]MEA1015359.1 acyl-CoA dehydrogenase family protein [Sphingosinicella sp. LY1275]